MKIVHFSDWHGKFSQLPEADLYICTGDLLDNYPVKVKKMDATTHRGMYYGVEINKGVENHKQSLFLREFDYRDYLGNREAPVVLVRGNHDFVDLADGFAGKVFEVSKSVTTFKNVAYPGIKIGGFRGINYISGEWSDELDTPELDDLCRALPTDLDILVTHAPPQNFLDHDFRARHAPRYGVAALTSFLNKSAYHETKLRLHCFGHVHEGFGAVKLADTNILLSNAATGYNVIEYSDGEASLLESVRL